MHRKLEILGVQDSSIRYAIMTTKEKDGANAALGLG